jgi:integrase
MTTKRERGAGSLRLRGTTWWVRYHHAGRLIEESTGTGDEQKANTILRAKLKKADTPQFIDPSTRRLTFEDLCELLRRDYARRGNRTSYRLGTAETPRGPLIHLGQHFGGWQALAITTNEVDKYADARIAAGAQPATVNRELAALRRMFSLARQKGMLATAPHVAMHPEENVREGFVEIGDLDALLTALRAIDPVAADLTECAFLTCLRRGNLRALTWERFVLSLDRTGTVIGGELRLPGKVTKNKKPLALPLTERLLDLIDRRYRERQGPHVFQRDGKPVDQFPGTWVAATHAVGRDGLLFHDLRRSGARALRRAGITEGVIMKLGGWKTRGVFDRYNITDDRDLAEAQAKLNAAFSTARPTLVPLPTRQAS